MVHSLVPYDEGTRLTAYLLLPSGANYARKPDAAEHGSVRVVIATSDAKGPQRPPPQEAFAAPPRGTPPQAGDVGECWLFLTWVAVLTVLCLFGRVVWSGLRQEMVHVAADARE